MVVECRSVDSFDAPSSTIRQGSRSKLGWRRGQQKAAFAQPPNDGLFLAPHEEVHGLDSVMLQISGGVVVVVAVVWLMVVAKKVQYAVHEQQGYARV
eukprot:CAMPEP_0171859760 /NCGR_PEP_ID=MMETSP0992-20121227/26082_1 /TAXON_ID=483369 /ORGANISM="non described non described, Strain CCMP2098" /LENGTH=96 /DNA_ID=CAMNT_0012481459 /DNA_START=20 /DNA_END=310 /DNA_ORIENTATION=+